MPLDYPHRAHYPGLATHANSSQIKSSVQDTPPGEALNVIPATLNQQSGDTVQLTNQLVPSSSKEQPKSPVSTPDAPAPVPNASEETIDLEIALRLAGVENPTIKLARERIREALASQLAARALLLPSVNIGGNYHLHNGVLQASPGFIRKVNSQSLYMGFGARTLAAESVAFPGIRLFAHLGDAVYEPLAARQRVAARQSDSQAVQNAILLDVATAYFQLIGAEARVSILRKGKDDVDEVVRLTKVYAEKGQGRLADANRAAAHADLVREEEFKAEEDLAVASARLCELLNVDPSIRFRTPGGAIEPFRLISEETDSEELLRIALQSRPELLARSAEIMEAQVRLRQERVRPWVPLVSVGYSGGWFGGGSNLVDSRFGPMSGRSDLDVFAVWNIQNMGLGNHAQVRRADAIVGQSLADYSNTMNRVRDEVTKAQSDAKAAVLQIQAARTSIDVAEEGFRLESERIRQGQGVPIDTLDSFQQLLDARLELVRASIAFNIAQLRLFVAVGSDPLASPSPNALLPIPGIRPGLPKP